LPKPNGASPETELFATHKVVESESDYNVEAGCGCEVFLWKSPPQSKISGFPLANQKIDPTTKSGETILSEEKAKYQQHL
jgi:hypothetical protein